MHQGILVSFGQSCIQLQWHGIVCDHFELKVIPFVGVYSEIQGNVVVGGCFFTFFIRIQFILLFESSKKYN